MRWPLLLCSFLVLFSCGSPKPDTPPLNPEQANALLQFDNKAKGWMTYVQKQNPGCVYRLELPDQSAHPTTIDLDHIVQCGNRPSPRELDASVSFAYDKAQGKWIISRFSS